MFHNQIQSVMKTIKLSGSIGFIFLMLMSCTKKEKAAMPAPVETNETTVQLLVGTYTAEASEGIYALSFNPETGALSDQQLLAKSDNPSFLIKSKDGKKLIAVNETDPGKVSSFKWNEQGTSLILQSNVSTEGMHPCHVSFNKEEDLVAVANYSSGNLAVYAFNEGILTDQPKIRTHEGSSIVKPNQDGPHAHCSKFGKDGKFLYVADLGIDKIVGYALDEQKNLGEGFTAFAMDAGDGPRHFVHHPTKDLIYIVSEFSNTVTSAQVNRTTGEFTKVGKVSTLPADVDGDSFSADIHMTSNGKFLYTTNRGHNSIAIFSVAENGELTLMGTESVRGNWPRNFTLSPDEQFLLVANQLSDNITVFKIDQDSGLLAFTGTDVKLSRPVCLQF